MIRKMSELEKAFLRRLVGDGAPLRREMESQDATGEILTIANHYAAQNLNFGSAQPNATYVHLPDSKVWDITKGYKWYNPGLIKKY